MRCTIGLALLHTSFLFTSIASPVDAEEASLRATQKTAIAEIEKRTDELKSLNRALWELAEVGLEESQSSALLIEKLQTAGFDVKRAVSGMPTAFVATYGSGRPVIGILAEYDALPGMSQKVSAQREPRQAGAPGHACGHCGLGTGAVGAAIATKAAMVQHDLTGTIRLYGTPAEETVIGKVYMTLDGQFDDLDACLHWHPGSKNEAWASSSKALVSAKFTFHGTPSHASVSPESGRSALDAVELMDTGANYMREHLKEDARLHYVITDGGGAPNVVPPQATVWYFVRADSHRDVEYNFGWLQDIAKAAAQMTRTTMTMQVDTDCHEIVPNAPLAELVTKNLELVGAPRFTPEETVFARRLQEPLIAEFQRQFPLAIDDRIHRASPLSEPAKGSTDVGDVSWRVPTGGLRTTCFVADSPGHSWQNVACIASGIGEKGILFAAKTLAVTALDLLEDPRHLEAARADFDQRMEGRKYFSFIPEGQSPPRKIR